MKSVLQSNDSETQRQLLGGLSAHAFMQRYWHQQPLLIRNAIPGFKPLISKAQLFTLAKQDEVESRIVTRAARGDRRGSALWQLHHGPFSARDFRRPADQKWSLLVQGVNLYVAAADALLRRFNFVPYARIDDLMISVANEGGGVGPHVDSYDVFLLQAQGTRRWRISMQTDRTLVDGAPLKILKHFKHTAEYVLGPGDMLYLPPGCAHDGVAVRGAASTARAANGDCMTYSIGFRAPSAQELARGLMEHAAETLVRQGFYADHGLKPTARAAFIDDAYVNQAARLIGDVRPTRTMLETFLGHKLTEPKANVFFDAPAAPMRKAAFTREAKRRGVMLDLGTQMLYRGKTLFINGETAEVPLSPALAQLADARQLHSGAASATPLCARDAQALYRWYTHGWLHPSA